jgi:hypothetical protein
MADNSNETKKSLNRKVEILISCTKKIAEIIESKNDTCKGDTLIELNDGVLELVNKCELKARKSCQLIVNKFVRCQLKCKTTKKFFIMAGFRAKKKCKCIKKYIDYSVVFNCPDSLCTSKRRSTLYLPVGEVKESEFYEYVYSESNKNWVKTRKSKIKLIKKKKYATYSGRCGNTAPYTPHCCKGGVCQFIGCGGFHSNTECNYACTKPHFAKLKLKNGLKFLCADSVVGAEGKEKLYTSTNKKIIYFKPCDKLTNVKLIYKGDTLTFKTVELEALAHGNRQLKDCKQFKWFLFIKFYESIGVFRKYKFTAFDIPLQLTKPWLTESTK